MSYRVIETAANITARQPSISPLPQGVYYTDPTHGLVVDYIIEEIPEELIPFCICVVTSEGDILKEAPLDFTKCHEFAGWSNG